MVERGGRRTESGLGTSCKTEQVFLERDIWLDPNADMCAAARAGEFLIVKRWDRGDKNALLYTPTLGPQPERQCLDPRAAFETLHDGEVRRVEARNSLWLVESQ